MKKKYVSPEIKLIELQTENLMALSSVHVNSYNGKSDSDINEDIDPWGGRGRRILSADYRDRVELSRQR